MSMPSARPSRYGTGNSVRSGWTVAGADLVADRVDAGGDRLRGVGDGSDFLGDAGVWTCDPFERFLGFVDEFGELHAVADGDLCRVEDAAGDALDEVFGRADHSG